MDNDIVACYCGHASEIAEVKKSSSGGLATTLAQKVIFDGGVAYGCAYDTDYRGAHYERTETKQGLELFRGSKYLKPKWNNIANELIYDLKEGRKVIFVGLPCDVGAIYSLIKKKNINSQKLLMVDLICHGPTYNSVAREFIDSLEQKYHSKIKNFSVRYKNPHWNKEYCIRAEFENGKVKKTRFYDCDYGTAFMLMPLKGCYKCKYKGRNHCSDITIGDYWGVSKEEDGYSKFGTSLALVHSEKGLKIMDGLKGYYRTDNLDYMLRNNTSYYTVRKETVQCVKFAEDYKNMGLHKAVMKNTTLKHKIKCILPNIINSILCHKQI